MFRRRTRLSGIAAFAALLIGAAACGGGGGGNGGGGGSGTAAGFAACDKSPNTCNSGKASGSGTLTYSIEKDIPNWNINSSEGNVFESAETLTGVLPQVFVPQPDFTVALNKDLMVSVEQTKTNPQTIVYKIQPDAVWSDGTPITAEDFTFLWKTMNGKDCPKCVVSSTSGYDRIKSVKGSDNGKTVTVTMAKPFADWKAMFGGGNNYMYPAHIAKQHGDLSTPAGLAKAFEWFGKNVPTYSAGPFKIQKFQSNVAVTEVPNPKWYGDGPNLDKLVFRIITDATQEPTALANGEVDAIYPQPEVDLVDQIKQIQGVDSHIGMGLVWEHFDLNLKNKFLADKTLRQAMFTAIDRKAIIAKTVGQFTNKAEPLNNHNFVPGQNGYKDVVSATGHGSGNVDKAKKMLTDAGYKIQGGKLITPDGKTVSQMRIRYTTGNAIRKNECELFAQQVKPLGIDIKVQPTDDLGGTLVSGDYDVMVFAWVGSPFPFGGAQQNWTTGQGGNYGHYSNKQVDDLINKAASSTGGPEAIDMLNQADEIMSKDAYVLPLYQKPTFLAVSKKYVNIRDNPTNVGPPYNVAQWGVRADAG